MPRLLQAARRGSSCKSLLYFLSALPYSLDTPSILPRYSLVLPQHSSCSFSASLLLPLKRLCSLFRPRTVTPNPKFGMYIIYVNSESFLRKRDPQGSVWEGGKKGEFEKFGHHYYFAVCGAETVAITMLMIGTRSGSGFLGDSNGWFSTREVGRREGGQ